MKKITIFLLVVMISVGSVVGVTYASILSKMAKTGMSYSDTVEEMIAGMVPEEGITIKGRNYGYWDVVTFLDEVRWVPDNYVHKDHHCALASLPEEEVQTIVKVLRVVMGCK